MQMTHKHNKWLQILLKEDFPENLLRSEASLSTEKATPRTGDRGTGERKTGISEAL